MRTKSLLLLLCLALAPYSLWAQSKRVSVGILPVFDASGDVAGEVMSQGLTLLTYEALRDSSVYPVLLSPGGVYASSDKEWALDYARQAGVDAVLVSTLQPSNRPKKGDWTVRVETELLEVAGGKSAPVQMHTELVNRVHLNFIDTGTYNMQGMEIAASRPFEKQELGKKARKLAESIRGYVISGTSLVKAGTSPVLGGSAACRVDFRIEYPNQANSFAYSLVANRRDETLFIKEGVASLDTKTGPIVLQLKLNDAPYRLPVQRLYQLSAQTDCGKATQSLTMRIGPAGEALLIWH